MPLPILVFGADAGSAPVVKVYNAETGEFRFQFYAYDKSFLGGVRVAEADLNHDGIPDIVTAPGPGMAPEIRSFDGVTGRQLAGPVGDFLAYDESFLGGVFVAAGEAIGNGRPDIVTAPGAAGGSLVKVFSSVGGTLESSFSAYDSEFSSDVHLALLPQQDGSSEIVTAPGAGSTPLVHVFNASTGQQIAGPLGSFLAYEPGFLGGVNVAGGDVDGDGQADLITGPGAGRVSEVKVFNQADGGHEARFPGLQSGISGRRRASPRPMSNGDAYADIFTAQASGSSGLGRVFNSATGKTFTAA